MGFLSSKFQLKCHTLEVFFPDHGCMHAKLLQSCLTLCNPMICSLPGSSVHGILQATILEWAAMPLSRGSSWPRDQTHPLCQHWQAGSLPLVPPGKSFSWSPYLKYTITLSSVQSLNRVQLCNPMDYSTPGFPVHHQLPEPIQTHVHHVGDAIQPSHPLSSPYTTAFNLSQHQGLFQWAPSILWRSAFSIVQLSHPYMTTGKP